MNTITGVLIAGGKSSRMGTNKLELLHGNQSFAMHAIELLRQFCSQVVISYNGEPFTLEYPFIKDQYPDIGPIAGIASAMQAATTPYLLVLACDMPLLSASTLQQLIDNCEDHDITAYGHSHGWEPLCAIYHRRLQPLIIGQIENRQYSLQKLKLGIDANILPASNEVMTQLKNINTPTDYQQLKAMP